MPGTPIQVTVGAPSASESILKKSESAQRVREDATEGFQLKVVKEDESGEENLTVDRLTSDTSPVIRLVDSTIFTAIQRRASDIHIETGDDAVHVKYRIDGVLQPAMRPIAREFHSPIISRIKVMAELDIAEKRVPQDGRFKLRMPGKTIDFRVSIMPSVHGEDAVIRILDKASDLEPFTALRPGRPGLPAAAMHRARTSTPPLRLSRRPRAPQPSRPVATPSSPSRPAAARSRRPSRARSTAPSATSPR